MAPSRSKARTSPRDSRRITPAFSFPRIRPSPSKAMVPSRPKAATPAPASAADGPSLAETSSSTMAISSPPAAVPPPASGAAKAAIAATSPSQAPSVRLPRPGGNKRTIASALATEQAAAPFPSTAAKSRAPSPQNATTSMTSPPSRSSPSSTGSGR